MNTIIQTPTPDLSASIDFYSRLGFTILSEAKPTLVSDGQVVIEINPDRYARAGIKLYKPDWGPIVALLKKATAILNLNSGYLLSDPGGTWVYLLEAVENQMYDLADIPPSVLGNAAGITLENIDMQQSLEIWQMLGFKKEGGSPETGWISLRNADGAGLSLLQPLACPHLFFNPSLSYFNGKSNLEVIQKIRNLNIPITEEITYFNKKGIVDNIILRDPGGLGFFIFSD